MQKWITISEDLKFIQGVKIHFIQFKKCVSKVEHHKLKIQNHIYSYWIGFGFRCINYLEGVIFCSVLVFFFCSHDELTCLMYYKTLLYINMHYITPHCTLEGNYKYLIGKTSRGDELLLNICVFKVVKNVETLYCLHLSECKIAALTY